MVVTDHGVLGYADVLIQDDAMQAGAPADVAIVENDALIHHGSGVDFHGAPQHRVAHHAAGENAGAGDDGIDGLSAAVLLIEGKLGRWIGIARGAYGPFAVV